MIQISNKQKEFLTSKFSRINLLEGSVRSGKTWISLVAWALFVASMPKNVEFLMVGKTITTLKRNCLVLLQDLEPTFTYNTGAKQAYLYGRTIWLEGANDERSENKIRGMTLAGVYMDELTLIPEGFYYMALSRLSIHGAKLFATTNPDAPTNYVYTDIICNDEIARKITKFHITDNPFLDPEYVESLKHEYTGVFYERYFLGNWVKAEGLVYPMFDNVMPTQNRTYSEFCVSMDYGTLNPTAMLLWGHCSADDVWYIIDEFYHSGRDTNYQKTDEEYYEDLCNLCGDRAINRVYIDPSAASFITLVRRRGRFHVNKANNDVMEGIQHTASCLADRRIIVNDCCKNTIKEFGLYSWDESKNTDAVIKENDHCLSADTMVHTLFGKRKIKDLLGKRGWVWSYDERKRRKVLRRFRDVRQTAKDREMLRITFANGKMVECTPDHLILTQRGWVEAGKLDTTDYAVDIMGTK